MDTAGQEEYSALRDQYMKTGEGFVLVYSVTSRSSFETVTKLRTSIIRMKQEAQDFPIVLVGNKKDLAHERVVSTEEGKQMADKFKIPFMETSAKSNENVADAFHQLVREIIKYRLAHPVKKAQKKRGCPLL
eukprot:TRINITY_DN3886_c0_g1_i2.p3 TRINITY_DN3886_c0_g1~~TRINITY_DN3886_c0_g1_i2.p3  ORF type:complete len:132 (+),score=42.87 TRINITY_DN3886_c0_g1_i2:531-926(+)